MDTLAIIIVGLILICLLRFICQNKLINDIHADTGKKKQQIKDKEQKLHDEQIYRQRIYKTPDSLTVDEFNYTNDIRLYEKSFRSRYKDVSMNSHPEYFEDSIECSSRSAFQPPVQTASCKNIQI
jgi:hypothetical protein